VSDKSNPLEEHLEQMIKIENICKSASELCAFTMFHMQTGEFGIAVSDDEIAIGFFDRLKELYVHLSGDTEADGKFELQYHTDGDDDEDDRESGSTQADKREESGVVRPRDRKLH
jgi:hypothetical protein